MLAIANTSNLLSNVALSAFHDEFAKMARALLQYECRVDEALASPLLSFRSRRFLTKLWYGHPDAPLSLAHKGARDAMTKAMMMALLQRAQDDICLVQGTSRFRLCTCCPNEGYAGLDGGTLSPGLIIDRWHQEMTARQLEGVGFLDVALIGDRLGSPTHVGLHFHGACSQRRHPTLNAANAQLDERNRYGLAVFDVASDEGRPNLWRVARLGYYISKVSCGSKEDEGDWTNTSQTRWTFRDALRALEAYSYFAPADMLVSAGGFGDRLRNDCLSRFSGFLVTASYSPHHRINVQRRRASWARLYDDLMMDSEPFRIAS